jgi:ankyrin repeat protein
VTEKWLDEMDEEGETPLTRMMESNHPLANAMMAFVTLDEEEGGQNESPVHDAVRHKSFGKLKDLLEEDADVDELNEDGLTPLYWCCLNGSVDMAKLLINRGAEVNTVDTTTTGLSLHDISQLMGYTELSYLFLASGAHI